MSIPVVEHKPIDDSVLFDAKRIVFLSSDSCMIGSISRIVLCDDRIYLLDTQTDAVWIYDMQGNHIGHIRAVGRAANEYINLMDFFVDRESKQIVLYADPSKFLFYDYNLKPTRVMKAPALFYETVNSGEQIVCFNARTADPECCISVLAEKNGDPLKIKNFRPPGTARLQRRIRVRSPAYQKQTHQFFETVRQFHLQRGKRKRNLAIHD